MSDLDDIVRQAVQGVTAVAAKAVRFSTRLLVVATVVCVGGFLLGVAALSGGVRTVWIVLGIVFAAIAVGGSLLARWRVGSVRRHVPELADEVRSLVSDGRDAGRTVIDTFVVGETDDADPGNPGAAAGSAIVIGRRLHGFRSTVGSGLESSARLTAAVTALTSFPALVAAAIFITLVFAFLGVIFLIALAL